MGFGRKRATRHAGGVAARAIGWLLVAGALAASLAGCPPAGGTREAAAPTPTPGYGSDPLPRELGRAFMATARAHQALALGDPALAARALEEAAGRLLAAREAAPPTARRRVLALEDRVLVAQAALAAGDPRGLAQAHLATKRLLDALLADGDAVAMVGTEPPAGGGGGARADAASGTPAGASGAAPAPRTASAAPVAGRAALGDARVTGGPAPGGELPAWAEPAVTQNADGAALRAGAPPSAVPSARPTAVAPAAAPRAQATRPASTAPVQVRKSQARASAAPKRTTRPVAAAPKAAVPPSRKAQAVRQGLARGIVALAAAHRELVGGRPQAALPHVRQLRRELRYARQYGDLAGQKLVAGLDVQANQVAYQARKGSPLAAREARRLLGDCLNLFAFGEVSEPPVPGRFSAPRNGPTRALVGLAAQARLDAGLAARPAGGGGGALPVPVPVPDEDPTLAE